MFFGEKMVDLQYFPEDMSQDGELVFIGTNLDCNFSYWQFSILVKPPKDSQSGVVEFCNSGTRYSKRKIHTLLKELEGLISKTPEGGDTRRLKIKIGNDGDIRVFITENSNDKFVVDILTHHEIKFYRRNEETLTIFKLLEAFFKDRNSEAVFKPLTDF